MCPRCTLGLLVLGAHAKMPPLRHVAAERCESGRFGVPGEHVCWQRHRGFESHPHRHHVQLPYSHSVELVDAKKPMKEGGIRTGVLKGVCPLHGVTERSEGARGLGPLAGARAAPKRDDECPPSPPAFAKASAGRPAGASRKVVTSLSPVCRSRLDDVRTFGLANARRGWALCNRIL